MRSRLSCVRRFIGESVEKFKEEEFEQHEGEYQKDVSSLSSRRYMIRARCSFEMCVCVCVCVCVCHVTTKNMHVSQYLMSVCVCMCVCNGTTRTCMFHN